MNEYLVKRIDRKYSREMLKILRSAPITTKDLTLYFDRQPSMFKMAEIKYNPHQYGGLFDQDQLKGFGMIGYHPAMVNGDRQIVFHIKDFYVSPEARGNGFVDRVTNDFFSETYQDAKLGYAVIMSGNIKPHYFIGRQNPLYPNIPYTRIINQLEVRNILLVLPLFHNTAYKIRPAADEDIPLIVALLNNEHRPRLFGNYYEEETFQNYLKMRPDFSIRDYYLAFDRSGKCTGVCAAWNCAAFKQTRVLAYGKRFKAVRMLYNGLALLLNRPLLPRSGESFRELFITDYAIVNRNPMVFNSLLRFIYRKYLKKGYQNMILGSSRHDPLLEASKGFFGQKLISNIVLISTDSSLIQPGMVENNLPYIDLPFL